MKNIWPLIGWLVVCLYVVIQIIQRVGDAKTRPGDRLAGRDSDSNGDPVFDRSCEADDISDHDSGPSDCDD
jgi:hypothetical protein